VVEIVSQGQTAQVTDEQLLEIQSRGVSWFEYCLWRQTLNHEQAMAQFAELGGDDKAATSD
jgi:hypothetical protein